MFKKINTDLRNFYCNRALVIFASIHCFGMASYVEAENIAIGKSIYTDSASANEGDGSRQSANDGDMATQWSGYYPDPRCSFGFCGAPEFITVNLEGPNDISKINILWGENFPEQYQLQVSNDQINWVVMSDYVSDGGVDTFTFEDGVLNASYVQVLGIEPASISRGWNVIEFEVYNTDSVGSACDGIDEWSSTQVYLGGQKTVFANTLYQANWWTLGTTPSDYQWGPWLALESCEG